MWCGCLEPFGESVARWLGGSSTSIERRHVLKGMVATLSLAGAGCASTTPAQKIAGTALLDETISIDLHSHPGLVRSLARATMNGHIERLAAFARSSWCITESTSLGTSRPRRRDTAASRRSGAT